VDTAFGAALQNMDYRSASPEMPTARKTVRNVLVFEAHNLRHSNFFFLLRLLLVHFPEEGGSCSENNDDTTILQSATSQLRFSACLVRFVNILPRACQNIPRMGELLFPSPHIQDSGMMQLPR
jgi:hypothetical protein